VSRQAYVTAGRLGALRWSLDREQWAVLHDVDTMRVASTLDLQALHALRQELRVRPFRYLVKGLADSGVLSRLEGRSVGGKRAGSAGFVYVVGPAGQHLLAAEQSQPVRRGWTPRPSWLKHALAVSHLYVELRQLEHAGSLTLRAFEAEPRSWRSYTDAGAANVIKPDGFIELGIGDYFDSYFIEVDCGTESTSTLGRKFEAYAAYWRSGLEQRQHGVFPKVLWLAPSDKRRLVIGGVAGRQQPEARQLHQVVRYDQATAVFRGQPP
jgi:hypothetical protein